MYSGDYPQPLVRKQEFHLPIVGGFTTGRLYSPITVGSEVFSVSGYDPGQTRVLVENTGLTSVSVTLKQTNDYISGPRTQIGGTIALVPKGQKYFPTFFPTQKYLEVSAPSASASGTIRMQIEGQIHWSIMAFDKTETIYPSTLAKHQPDNAPFPT